MRIPGCKVGDELTVKFALDTGAYQGKVVTETKHKVGQEKWREATN